jgi:tetratricopeptide (TPR) repeat protein
MKTIKQTLLLFIMTVALSVAGNQVFAQSSGSSKDNGYRKAYKAFKKAKSLAQNKKYDKAITWYKQAISDAQGGGKNNAMVIKLCKKQIPGLYYELAVQDYKAYQSSHSLSDINKTIDSFKTASQAGKKYGQSEISKDSQQAILQLMYAKSLTQYNNKKYQEALNTINQTIKLNPNYARAYYQKGLIYKKMNGHSKDAFASFDKAISVGKKAGKSGIVRKAKSSVSGELVYEASKQLQNNHYTTAINLLKKSFKYNSTSPDAYYRLAAAYNGLGKYSSAVSAAKKGLGYEKGGRSSKAKFYYEEAKAYQGAGKNSEACKAFAKASYGRFKNSAHHAMKYELRCKE